MPKANVTWQRMPSAILITPAKIGSKQNENFVKDIREAFARRAFVIDILPFSYPLLPPLNISLLPGGPANRSTTNPAA